MYTFSISPKYYLYTSAQYKNSCTYVNGNEMVYLDFFKLKSFFKHSSI